MANKMTHTFCETLNILDALSQSVYGLTAGTLQKMMPGATVGQVKRMLASLEACAFVHTTIEPHGRTGKTVYHMTEHAAIIFASLARQYSEKIG